jgi:hypothetical protein
VSAWGLYHLIGTVRTVFNTVAVTVVVVVVSDWPVSVAAGRLNHSRQRRFGETNAYD